MKTNEVISQESRLKDLFDKYSSLPDDEYIKARWSEYLCIRIYGYLEVAIKELIGDYSSRCSSPKISSYVVSQIKNFRSPNMENILKLMGMFDASWRDEIESQCNDEIRTALDSIVANRHNLSHGKNVGVSIGNLKPWYKNALCFVEIFQKKLQ